MNWIKTKILKILFTALICTSCGLDYSRLNQQETNQLVAAVQSAGKSVVNVSSFYVKIDEKTKQQVTLKEDGSAVVISSSGYLLTNAHVVEGNTQIKITGTDGVQRNAQLVAANTQADIALLKIEPTDALPAIKIGNSCLLYTSPSPRDQRGSRMPSSA